MKTRLFNFLSAASLVTAVYVAGVWFFSTEDRDRLRVPTPWGRYTLESYQRRLRLSGPPAPPPGADERKGWEVVARLSNHHLRWEQHRLVSPGRTQILRIVVEPAEGTAAWEVKLGPSAAGIYTRPLLKALDDPHKFMAAHVLLRAVTAAPPWGGTPPPWGGVAGAELRSGGKAFCWYDGMGLELLQPDAVEAQIGGVGSGAVTSVFRHGTGASWRVDPAQREALADLWHERLDARLGPAVSHGWVVGAAMVLPGVWLARWRRRAWREASGRCVRCGYDLCESPERCPECGEPCVGDDAEAGAGRPGVITGTGP